MFPHPRFRRRACRRLLPFLGGLLGACAESPAARTDSTSVPAVATRAPSIAPAPADTDDFGAPLPTDARHAERVVSLNPTATEAIFAIGAGGRLVGRSKWDEFPGAAHAVPAVGDGIRPAVEAVLAQRPTLVILYATAENRGAAEQLARAGVRTLAVRVDRIAHFHALLRTLGVALGAQTGARAVSDSVQATLDRVQRVTAALPPDLRPRVVWPVWATPPMVIGGGSYLDELLTIAGARNVFHDMASPSPSVSIEEIVQRAPQFVVTSERQATALAANASWRTIPAISGKQFILEDPALTGRPSVVLGMAAVHLARALHPALADSLR